MANQNPPSTGGHENRGAPASVPTSNDGATSSSGAGPAPAAAAESASTSAGTAATTRRRKCYKCKEFGHGQADCQRDYCFTCGELGHVVEDCTDQDPGRQLVGQMAMTHSDEELAAVLRALVDAFPERALPILEEIENNREGYY